MSKIKIKKFPREIDCCLKNVHIKVIKTRSRGKDRYVYEISADGTEPFILDPCLSYDAGECPEFEDTWCGGKWDNGKFKGCEYDINIMDKSDFGGETDDDNVGLRAAMYGCEIVDGETQTNTNDEIPFIPVTCWFENSKGKRTEFKCDDSENFVELFGEWDGKKLPTAKEREFTVTGTLMFEVTYVTKATNSEDAKKEAFKRLTEIYHKKGIENLGVLGSLTIKEKQ